jgi:hypothetical protein
MSIDEIKNLQQLIATHKSRLQKLKEQEALYGISVDPRVLIEIERIEEKIAKLQDELSELTSDETSASSLEGTALRMVISSVLGTFSVDRISGAQLLEGGTLLELFYTVDKLIQRYQELCDEILQVVIEARIEKKGGLPYGSARSVSEARLTAANRKLTKIASDMRQISSSLNGILARDSELLLRAQEVLEICVAISIVEDWLALRLGAPPEVREQTERVYGKRYMGLVSLPGQAADLPESFGTPITYGTAEELQTMLSDLDRHRTQLRDAIGRLASRQK